MWMFLLKAYLSKCFQSWFPGLESEVFIFVLEIGHKENKTYHKFTIYLQIIMFKLQKELHLIMSLVSDKKLVFGM